MWDKAFLMTHFVNVLGLASSGRNERQNCGEDKGAVNEITSSDNQRLESVYFFFILESLESVGF